MNVTRATRASAPALPAHAAPTVAQGDPNTITTGTPIPADASPITHVDDKDTEKGENSWLSLGTVLTVLSVVASIGTTLYPYGLVVLQRQYVTVDTLSSNKAWVVVTSLPKSIVVLHGVEALIDRVTIASCVILLIVVALYQGVNAFDARAPFFKGHTRLKKAGVLLIGVIVVGKIADRVLPGAPSFTVGTYAAVIILMLVCATSMETAVAQLRLLATPTTPATSPPPRSATTRLYRAGAVAVLSSYLAALFYAYSLLPTTTAVMPVFTFDSKVDGRVTGEAITSSNGYWTVVETTPHRGQLRLMRNSDVKTMEP